MGPGAGPEWHWYATSSERPGNGRLAQNSLSPEPLHLEQQPVRCLLSRCLARLGGF